MTKEWKPPKRPPNEGQCAICLSVVLLVMGPCNPTSPRVQRLKFRFADDLG